MTVVTDLLARLRAAGCVFAEEEAALLVEAARDPTHLDALVARRVAGDPLEQILGWAEFRGRRIVVEPGVFVPRRRSAFLVDRAIARIGPGAVVVDLCCGSGALGAAVAAEVDVVLHAVDHDPAAVRCAARNVPPGATVHRGDLFDALPADLAGRVDLVVAVPPYVPSAAVARMPPEARDHEPRHALDGGADGLDVVRRIAAAAGRWLAPGGHVLLEVGEHQAPAVADVLHLAYLVASVERNDATESTITVGSRRF